MMNAIPSFRGVCLAAVAAGLSALCGCGANYSWRPSVPEGMRTVVVPTFQNESDVSELGAVAARQLAREIQREGTFRLKPEGEATLEVQGVVKSAGAGTIGYDRRGGLRITAGEYQVVAEVSVVDRRAHKVLIDNRAYRAQAPVTVNQDRTTALRDASGRVMEDLARQVVDDLLKIK